MPNEALTAQAHAAKPSQAHSMIEPTMPPPSDAGIPVSHPPAMVSRSELEAVERELDEALEQRDRLAAALGSIAEYWNRNQNETAMADACWHAINTAEEAIAAVKGGSK